ncbi:MAG: hypothetical protein Q8Q89_00925 [bacterium]|nr:hypothetical protein [bacterium]
METKLTLMTTKQSLSKALFTGSIYCGYSLAELRHEPFQVEEIFSITRVEENLWEISFLIGGFGVIHKDYVKLYDSNGNI